VALIWQKRLFQCPLKKRGTFLIRLNKNIKILKNIWKNIEKNRRYFMKNEKKKSVENEEQKKNKHSIVMLVSVVLNIVLLIVCIDTITVKLHPDTTKEEQIWGTAVANALYCAKSFHQNESDTAYYYIIGETGTLVDLLAYTGFGNDTQKKQYENLYQILVSYPDVMRTKGEELENIFTMLSEEKEEVFDVIEEMYTSVTGTKEDTREGSMTEEDETATQEKEDIQE
jgi:hypothetical protein